jgi:hypothetical protein
MAESPSFPMRVAISFAKLSIRQRAIIFIVTLLVAVIGFATFGGHAKTPDSKGPPAIAYSYSCCIAKPTATYQPGEDVRFHWIRTMVSATGKAKTRIDLSVYLQGPYASAAILKNTTTNDLPDIEVSIVAAPTLRISNRTGTYPVSTLQLPDNAKPGWYELTFTTKERLQTVTNGTIIRVVPKGSTLKG